MTAVLSSLGQMALKLDMKDRAALAELLLSSLDNLSETEHDRLCLEEVERRCQAYREGRMSLVPADEAIAGIRKSISCKR